MADKEKTQKAQEEERKAPKTPDQSMTAPPTVPAGKKAVWHKPYSYQNTKGTTINIRGHWEIIDIPKGKPKDVAPAPAETEAES